jgi:hypothetical protein
LFLFEGMLNNILNNLCVFDIRLPRLLSFSRFGNESIVEFKEIQEQTFVCELWHGPTLAFKDLGLQVRGWRCFEISYSREERENRYGNRERENRYGYRERENRYGYRERENRYGYRERENRYGFRERENRYGCRERENRYGCRERENRYGKLMVLVAKGCSGRL